MGKRIVARDWYKSVSYRNQVIYQNYFREQVRKQIIQKLDFGFVLVLNLNRKVNMDICHRHLMKLSDKTNSVMNLNGKDRIKFYCFCEEGIFNTHSNVFLDYAIFNENKKEFVLNYIKDNWRKITRSGDLKCDANTERDNEYWIRYSTKFLNRNRGYYNFLMC